ncbi:MAG: histidinol dehydrogenase [Planctomycetota bacterium]
MSNSPDASPELASPETLVTVVDARQGATDVLATLREKLSPRGDLVSERGRELTRAVFGQPLTPIQVVETICQDVQSDGLDALLRYTKSLDHADLTPDQLRVPAEDLAAAHAGADPRLIETVRRIRDRIVEFQSAIRHHDVTIEPRPGVRLQQRYVALPRVGICVPGGAAAYPSTVMMTAIPAQVAGVDEIAVVAPPTQFGAYNNDMLATCHELGITEVYRCGGAQAVAAMAYGVEGLPRVDKIVGPGNLFVALAKKHVFGTVDIDSFAGPSEVIVIADSNARADYVAADLLAQAEHSPGSAILMTWDETLVDKVQCELARQLSLLERAELTRAALADFGTLILVRDADHACELTDSFAPEHLHIETADPESMIASIRHSGAAFLGHYTPVALGDYAAGPSHVLPTGGTCRWAAGLSVNSFLRSGSVTSFDAAAMEAIADDVIEVADREGLTAHARSVSVRRSQEDTSG